MWSVALPLAAINQLWYSLPLIVVISLVYSATRYDYWDNIFREAFRWGLRMSAFLAGIAVILYVMSIII